MPHPEVRGHESIECKDTSQPLQQHAPCCCGGCIALKDAVDNLALRQERLLDRIDTSYEIMVEKLKASMDRIDGLVTTIKSESCVRSSEIAATGLAVKSYTKNFQVAAATAMKSTGSAASAASAMKSMKSAASLSQERLDKPAEILSERSGPRLSTVQRVSRFSKDLSSLEGGDFSREDPKQLTWRIMLQHIVRTRLFEIMAGSVIFVNMAVMFAQLQWQSCAMSNSLGRSPTDCNWSRVSFAFKLADYAFNLWYIVEMVLRICACGWGFFLDRLNIFDMVLLCIACVQHGFSQDELSGVAPLRFLRVLRALRVVRVIRLVVAFRELHILIKTLTASFFSLQWSILLVGVIVWSSGLLMMQLLESYIQDTSQNSEIREAMYVDFGSPLRAGFSMFVATFSASWAPTARIMAEHVNPLFGLFWILYILVVNFAVVRVIAALFLKQTMDVANHDSERRAMESHKHKEKLAEGLRDIFEHFDLSGDGRISRDEFAAMVDCTGVLHMFETLGLDYEEVCALFDVMASDDGFTEYEEFLHGATLMKSSARTFDTIRIMHQLETLTRSVHDIQSHMGVHDEEAEG